MIESKDSADKPDQPQLFALLAGSFRSPAVVSVIPKMPFMGECEISWLMVRQKNMLLAYHSRTRHPPLASISSERLEFDPALFRVVQDRNARVGRPSRAPAAQSKRDGSWPTIEVKQLVMGVGIPKK